jgi:myo-inositol 2-dehydrogenase/D-chiro-inositol 1-dehydrogenase
MLRELQRAAGLVVGDALHREQRGTAVRTRATSSGWEWTEVAARGLPILCEKPCGLTVAQTNAAVATTQAAGLPFQVAYWRRYVPPLRALRERIAAGELGTIHLVACYQWDDRPPSDEFRAPAAASSPTWACTSSTRCAG